MKNSLNLDFHGPGACHAHHNLTPAELYEFALAEGDLLTSTGALVATSGACTGRCPKDKRIVDEPASSGDVWWGSVNIKLSPDSFAALRQQACEFLAAQPRVFVVDGYVGWDPRRRLKVRVLAPGVSRAVHAQHADSPHAAATGHVRRAGLRDLQCRTVPGRSADARPEFADKCGTVVCAAKW